MVKPNYAFAKRQKELAKKQKNLEKQQRKAQAGEAKAEDPLENEVLVDAPLTDEVQAAE